MSTAVVTTKIKYNDKSLLFVILKQIAVAKVQRTLNSTDQKAWLTETCAPQWPI